MLRVRYRLLDSTWDRVHSRLAALGYRAAIVGPHGSGKTTLLEDLEPHLVSVGFSTKHLRLDQTDRTFARGFLAHFAAGLSDRDVILFDGADELGGLAWRRFRHVTRRAAGVIVTTHRTGLLPTLIDCRTTQALMHEILEELVGEESRDLRCAADALYDRHHGNVRDVLRALFDRCASGGPTGGTGEAGSIKESAHDCNQRNVRRRV